MRESLVNYLLCPRSGEQMELSEITRTDAREIREGNLRAARSPHTYPILNGIPHLLPDDAQISEVKLRERRGWVELARVHEGASDRDRLLGELPFIQGDLNREPHWRQAMMSFPVAMALMEPLTGKRILDIGAWVGWGARRFAEAGAEAVALDFNADPEHGLGKADLFFARGSPYFERVCADAEHLPFADASFDHAFCCASIHHFESPTKLLGQIARILRPGGRFIAINEAFHPLLRSRQKRLRESAQTVEHLSYGINEQIFPHGAYRRFFEDAGLRFDAIHPRWDARKRDDGTTEVARGAGLAGGDFRLSDLDKSKLRVLANRMGIQRLLRLSPIQTATREILFHFTGSFRILVGSKPGE